MMSPDLANRHSVAMGQLDLAKQRVAGIAAVGQAMDIQARQVVMETYNMNPGDCPLCVRISARCQVDIAFSELDPTAQKDVIELLVIDLNGNFCGAISSEERRGCWQRFKAITNDVVVSGMVATSDEAEQS